MEKQKTKKIIYWIVTGIFVFELLLGALWDFDLVNKSFAGNVLVHLGYPLYFLTILGAGKMLAAFVIMIPGFLILKEWAYAGSAFIFIGAFASHLFTGDGIPALIAPAVYTAFTFGSYYLRPANRKIALQPKFSM